MAKILVNFIFIVAVLLLSITGSEAQSPTYGQLAQTTITNLFPAFQTNFPTLTSSSAPSSVSTLRKATLYVRDALDVFPYAYPTPQSGKPDLWALIRGSMNDGYTIIGNFQDLAHSGVNYTQAEYDRLIGDCMSWKANYTSLNSTYGIEQYLLNPDPTKYYFRDTTKYSEFFWQSVPFPAQPVASARPRNVTGYGTVTFLAHSLLTLAVKRYDSVYNLSEVYSNKKHSEFHDYRKLVRTIIAISGLFPLFQNNSAVNDSLTVLNAVYNNFGNLNDNATAYLFYHDNNGSSWLETEIARLNVVIGWAQLQMWMLNASIVDSLTLLQTNFINAIPIVPPIPGPKSSSHAGLVLGLIFGLFVPLIAVAAVGYWVYRRRQSGYELLERQSFTGR